MLLSPSIAASAGGLAGDSEDGGGAQSQDWCPIAFKCALNLVISAPIGTITSLILQTYCGSNKGPAGVWPCYFPMADVAIKLENMRFSPVYLTLEAAPRLPQPSF